MTTSAPPRSIVIAGGSGFIGISLAHHLTLAGFQTVILARHKPKVQGPWRFIQWDARSPGPWISQLNDAAGLVNLAGRSVDCIKSPNHQDEILRSRVEATHVLGLAVRTITRPPPVWVQMSTAHIFGDPPTVICDEDSALGSGFAPFVGRAWEEAFHANALPTQRKVVLRTSFVLGRDLGAGGSALARMRRLARLGLGGTIGGGTQGLSWIHQTDLNRIIERSIGDSNMQGTYIATAPHPVSIRQFMRAVRKALAIPLGLPAPAWFVRIGARLIFHTDPDLALYGRYLISRRLTEERFQFQFPELHAALSNLFATPNEFPMP